MHLISYFQVKAMSQIHTHGQKGTQICDPLASRCPQGHDSVLKTWEINLTRRDVKITVRTII